MNDLRLACSGEGQVTGRLDPTPTTERVAPRQGAAFVAQTNPAGPMLGRSSMFRPRKLFVAVALAIGTASPFAIPSAHATAPMIVDSSSSATTLTINGSNLGPGVATVFVGHLGPLTVIHQTPTQLVVALPTMLPGDYVLVVQVGANAGNADD